jgi:hypothetical protein
LKTREADNQADTNGSSSEKETFEDGILLLEYSVVGKCYKILLPAQ